MAHHQDAATRIAELNDEFRKTGIGGSRYITSGIQSEGPEFVLRATAAIVAFDTFNSENDPYGHHDFGCVTIDDQKVFWKIDYYDPEQKHGSEDPSDPSLTHRVLTIMFSHEY